MDAPILTIGKNLSGINIKYDYSKLVTKLYPRGTGSTPSELTLDNPLWFPSGDLSELVLDHTDADYAHFKLAGEYSAYSDRGFGYGDNWAINPGYYIGRDIELIYNQGHSPGTFSENVIAMVGPGGPGDAVAMCFEVGYSFRLYDVAFLLQRVVTPPGVTWTTQPRFVVGLYSATKSATISGYQKAGYVVPYQGPLCWCYGNLLSVSQTPAWYHFPLQTNQYPEGWYTIVVAPYPASNTQWGLNDYLAFGGSPSHDSSVPCYAEQCHNGLAPKNWNNSIKGGTVGTPYESQMAFQLTKVVTDVTSQFRMSGSDPGRLVKTAIKNYVPGATYVFHYQHTPYLINWDAWHAYGKIEGTYKDDSVTTQNALCLSATQYLASASQPIMTTSLSAADLYAIDPDKNWAEELNAGELVKVIDSVLGIEEVCVITKIDKQDLTQPHIIDTLTLNNVHLNAQKLMAQITRSSQRSAKYRQGQTVEAPYTIAGASGDTLSFYIRDATTLTHSVRVTVDAPGLFTLTVDGNPVNDGATYSGINEIDVLPYLTQAHNGQPTSGVHTVVITSST